MPQLILIDDDINFMNELKDSVDWESLGISSVCSSNNIENAKTQIVKNKIGIAICDVEMPWGTGFDLAKWVVKNHAGTQLILVTCHAEFQYAQEALKLGCVDYILKPVQKSELKSAVLRASQQLRESRQLSHLNMLTSFRNNFGGQTLNQFWLDIIRGKIGPQPEDLAKEAEFRKIPLPSLVQFIPAVIHLLPEHELDLKEEAALSYQAGKEIERLFWGDSSGEIVKSGKLQYLLLLDPESFDFQEVQVKFNKCFSNLQAAEKYQSRVLGYIGEKCYVHQLAGVYGRLQRRAAFHNFSPNGLYLLDSKATAGKSMQDWANLMNKGNTAEAIDSVKSVMKTVVHQNNGGAIDQFCYQLFDTAVRYSYLDAAKADALLQKEPYEKVTEAAEPMISKWVENIIDNAVRCRYSDGNITVVIDEVKQYIREHIGEDLCRESIANHVHLNPDYLNRLFRYSEKVSLMEYVTKVRVETAKGLLVHSTMMISEISEAIGYENFSNFTNMFHKNVGISPRKFRECRQAAE